MERETKERAYYPSPKKDREFTRRWKILCEDIIKRPGFRKAYLIQLEVLCDLYVKYDRLQAEEEMLGTTYRVATRSGDQEKTSQISLQLTSVIRLIEQYSKMLGFTLSRPEGFESPEDKKDEWA